MKYYFKSKYRWFYLFSSLKKRREKMVVERLEGERPGLRRLKEVPGALDEKPVMEGGVVFRPEKGLPDPESRMSFLKVS